MNPSLGFHHNAIVAAMLVCSLAIGCRGKSPLKGKSVAQLEAMLKNADPAIQAQGALGLSKQGAKACPRFRRWSGR